MSKTKKGTVKRAVKRRERWQARFLKALERDGRSMAEIARTAGLGRATIMAWRDGMYEPTLGNAMIIEEILGMEV